MRSVHPISPPLIPGLGPDPGWLGSGKSCRAGTATIELALALPVLMFLIMVLVQVTLLMVGQMVVHHAAINATRAAIVQIPRDLVSAGGLARNAILPTLDDEKFSSIWRSAVFSLVPVSGELDAGGFSTESYVAGLTDFFQQEAGSAPAWVNASAGARLRYAAQNTTITLLAIAPNTPGVNDHTISTFEPYAFGPHEPITVRVTHQLNLAVPWVRFLFADGQQTTANGPGAYTTVVAQYTLTNEGLDPNLPPAPDLPRYVPPGN